MTQNKWSARAFEMGSSGAASGLPFGHFTAARFHEQNKLNGGPGTVRVYPELSLTVKDCFLFPNRLALW